MLFITQSVEIFLELNIPFCFADVANTNAVDCAGALSYNRIRNVDNSELELCFSIIL